MIKSGGMSTKLKLKGVAIRVNKRKVKLAVSDMFLSNLNSYPNV